MVATHAEFDDAMSEAEYRQFALGDPQGQWELVGGRLREKPPMSIAHGRLMSQLGGLLRQQLDPGAFQVRFGHARLRISAEKYYVPDLVVIPTDYESALGRQPETLDAFPEPMPLVVEVWSPSTGGYDVDMKVPEYTSRGDLEIWRLHPFERTLTAWVRRPDGGYAETGYTGGVIRPSLPAGHRDRSGRAFRALIEGSSVRSMAGLLHPAVPPCSASRRGPGGDTGLISRPVGGWPAPCVVP